MSTPNQSEPQDDLSVILEIIREIAEKSASGNYIYRGEPECYDRVSSNLWRKYGIEEEDFDIEIVQKEMLSDAKRHIGHLPHIEDRPQDFRADPAAVLDVDEEDADETINFEILTEIQHYGGKTNLIDFTNLWIVGVYRGQVALLSSFVPIDFRTAPPFPFCFAPRGCGIQNEFL